MARYIVWVDLLAYLFVCVCVCIYKLSESYLQEAYHSLLSDLGILIVIVER